MYAGWLWLCMCAVYIGFVCKTVVVVVVVIFDLNFFCCGDDDDGDEGGDKKERKTSSFIQAVFLNQEEDLFNG